jgi:hypothetical protein
MKMTFERRAFADAKPYPQAYLDAVTMNASPEPSTYVLTGLGLVAFLAVFRFRKWAD